MKKLEVEMQVVTQTILCAWSFEALSHERENYQNCLASQFQARMVVNFVQTRKTVFAHGAEEQEQAQF